MIQEFNNIFNIFDTVIKSHAELYDFKFDIRLINKNEFFKKFYARFNAIVTLLQFIEIFKIFNFTRLLFTRLQYKVLK